MKRIGNLFPAIISWKNLLKASKNAQRGKRYHDAVLRFNYNLEQNLNALQQEITDHIYQPGKYKTFEVFDTKRRMISAAPYRDRVVHHAVCQVVMPIFENIYTENSYANRVEKGTHRAMQKLRRYVRTYNYVFKADIRKYFPSIDHEILKILLRRKIKCQDTLWLLDTIIDGSNPQEDVFEYFQDDDLLTPLERKTGLPIGNLTSQHFANIYLNPLDHFITESLGCTAYIRYVDDFVLLSNSKDQLIKWRNQIEQFLENIRLRIHPIKSQIFSINKGITFLGYRVFPNKVRVSNTNIKRARKRFHYIQHAYAKGDMSFKDVNQRIQSWIAHVSHANSWHLREKVICPLVFKRDKRGGRSGSSAVATGTTTPGTAGPPIGTGTTQTTRTTTGVFVLARLHPA